MIHLRSISKRREASTRTGFPFSVPVVRELTTLAFPSAVTFLVGENGSGKSTILEAIAAAVKLPTIGSTSTAADTTLAAQRELAQAITVQWSKRTSRGFFLRAEDFFGFAKSVAQMRQALLDELDEVAQSFADASSYARVLREGPIRSSLAEMERRYGIDLDANSHGQSFLRVFRERFVPGGLYLIDEPEAALSPQSQLALLMMIRELEQADGQFIIATHSPILLAYPGATIYSCDETPIEAVPYDSLAHVTFTRDFLRDPQRYLRHLDP